MSVNYTKESKDEAKARGQSLATIQVAGLNFQGPITVGEQRKLVQFYMEFTEEVNKRRAGELPIAPPPPAPPAPIPANAATE